MGVKITGNLAGIRAVRIGKIDAVRPAERRGSLIHQPTGLSKVGIFSGLPGFCQFDGGNCASVEQNVVNCAEQDFKCCG